MYTIHCNTTKNIYHIITISKISKGYHPQCLLASQDLDSYIAYLRDTVKLPAMDVQLNGGAQFRRHPGHP